MNIVERFLVWVYERGTKRPYWTVRGPVSLEFGPTPGTEIQKVFGDVPDDLLLAHGDRLLAAARRITREKNGDEWLTDARRELRDAYGGTP